MTELLKKNIKFEWSAECRNSMDELKGRLTTVLVLILPNSNSDYVIYSDDSMQGLGCILM